MHGRHRSPGNGLRSAPSGLGLATSHSRISPDASLRGSAGHAFHTNFNRFARSNSFQQPPRKPDIFVEAGRLAAEYLVSQGLLPPTVLSSKWQNGAFKRLVRPQPQEPENLQLGQEGRTSALARLGNVVPDAPPPPASASARRRFAAAAADEFTTTPSPSGFRTHPKGRRRPAASYRGYGSDWGRDYAIPRTSDRSLLASPGPDTDADADDHDHDDALSEHPSSDTKDGGDGFHKSLPIPNDLPSKTEEAPDLQPDLDKYQFPDAAHDMDSKPTSSTAWNDSSETSQGQQPHNTCDNLRHSNTASGKAKDSTTIDETGKQKASEGGSSNNSNTTDLLTSLTMCNFAKVPTRIRSSLTSKNPKIDPTPAIALEKASPASSQRKMQVLVGEDSGSLVGSSSDAMLHKTHDTKRLSAVQSAENMGELGPAYNLQRHNSLSLSDRASVSDTHRHPIQGPLGYGSCSSAGKDKERGEKRALEDADAQVGTKRPRDWPPSVVMDAGDCFGLSNLGEKKVSSLEDGASSGDRVIMAVTHENSLVNNSQFSKDAGEPRIEFSQEKQLFPSSFKICDLNLMEVSDVHENHDSDPIIIYPTLSEMKREAAPVDIDLSISNSNPSSENSRRPVDGKEIEVIDLENDTAQEDKDLVIADRKTETVYPDLEGFPNHAQNTGDIPDVQDGYGLMISELLGNDFPNCSSVPEHINPMHNDIGLHNGEGTLGDDDSIYMSLGEIPLTYLRPWEQPPPQEYEKPF